MPGANLAQVGLMPHEIWPHPGRDGHGETLHARTGSALVVLKTFQPCLCVPIHMHPRADRFIWVIHGAMTYVTQKGVTHVPTGGSTIIRAGYPHGFIVGEAGAKYISVTIGRGGKLLESCLPNHLAHQLNHARHDLNQLHDICEGYTPHSPYERLELNTLKRAVHQMETAYHAQEPLPFNLIPDKTKKPWPMQAWRPHRHAHLVKVRHYAISVTHRDEGGGREFIGIHEVFAMNRGLDRTTPRIPILN